MSQSPVGFGASSRFRFDGFGRGRTGVFREAWRKFPEASHVLVLDPDWELDAPRASRDHLSTL